MIGGYCLITYFVGKFLNHFLLKIGLASNHRIERQSKTRKSKEEQQKVKITRKEKKVLQRYLEKHLLGNKHI